MIGLHCLGGPGFSSRSVNIILTVLTQFEDLNLVSADATDKTKNVTTKYVLGFCHGQLRFCLLAFVNGSKNICNNCLSKFSLSPRRKDGSHF